MYSVFILTLLATLRLTTAAPSPTIESAGPASAGQVSDAKLKLRADTVYQVQGYSGSCIPENEITNVYGYDIDDGVCRFSSFPNGVPAGTDPAQSIKFTMPEGFTAQIFESNDCSVQTTEVGTNQCFTQVSGKRIGAWIVNFNGN